MLKKMFGDNAHNVGILALRVMVGVGFMWHGYMKLVDMPMIIKFFGMLHLSPFVAYVVMLTELLGGLAILLGFFTDYVVLPIIVDMACAVALTGMRKGVFWGHELELLFLVAAFAIGCIGAGKYSIDRLIKKH